MTAKGSTPVSVPLPQHRALYYGGGWHKPRAGGTFPAEDPATGADLGLIAAAGPEDVDLAVRAAARAFPEWRATKPLERTALLRRVVGIVRDHVEELALLDAVDGGNPVRAMVTDVHIGLATLDYLAGLVTEVKGETVPLGDEALDYTV